MVFARQALREEPGCRRKLQAQRMEWFRKIKQPKAPVEKKSRMPEDLWAKCNGCNEIIFKKEVIKSFQVCPKCNYHFRVSARERLAMLMDEGEYEELDTNIFPMDPLKFRDVKKYADRLKQSAESTSAREGVINALGEMNKIPILASVMEYSFMGGSMGSVVGEKVTRAVERSMEKRLPLIIVAASGGARMQEGAYSLMQMAKISAALARHNQLGIPYISILTDPTTGGVTASFAMLGDLNIAEPRALIGFAGPRVIEQTIRQKLPETFQRSEFLLEHGMLDMIVQRAEMKETLTRCLQLLM
jgi:acetyl-CoA carboxylase carboxyl transferase subunit beta